MINDLFRLLESNDERVEKLSLRAKLFAVHLYLAADAAGRICLAHQHYEDTVLSRNPLTSEDQHALVEELIDSGLMLLDEDETGQFAVWVLGDIYPLDEELQIAVEE